MMNEHELYGLRQQLITLFGGEPRDIDISVEDQLVCVPVQLMRTLAQRVRPRDALVGEIVNLMVGWDASDLAAAPNIVKQNLAERVLDALGVAVLVEGARPQTAVYATGEEYELTLDEFLAREGIGTPQERAVSSDDEERPA